MPNLVLIRGLPGSGKSTLAKTEFPSSWLHFENDMFLMKDGQYVFTPARRKQAVKQCLAAVEGAMKCGSNIVVSNCFLDRRSMDAYYELAGLYNYNLFEKVAEGNYPNVHGVPEDVLESMRKRWED